MRIGEIAAAAGVSTRSLRYYEEHGLLTSDRTASGQRVYTDDAVGRVRWIQGLFAAGLNSESVRQLLPCVHSGVVTAAMVARLREERDRIDARARSLKETRNRLTALIAEATAR